MAVPFKRRSETILVVEDEPLVMKFIELSLRRAGFTVLAAAGPEAARQIEAHHPGKIDLLLSDVIMLHTYGPELAEELQVRRPELRVMLMSGNLDDSHCLSYGGYFLQKPFLPGHLLDKVDEALVWGVRIRQAASGLGV